MKHATPWAEWSDTLIEVDTATGREVHRVDLSRLRVRYYAKRLKPAAPTELKADAPPVPDLIPTTDFGGLDEV